jgi:mannosyltransferase
METAVRDAYAPLPTDRLSGLAYAAQLLSPSRLVIAITLMGGLLRLYRYDALSLWVDEGLTVSFGRLPWDVVLGLHGAYETHPPLYFALVKAAELAAPELTAGRLVSVVAGTLTLPVLFFLAARLAGRWAAVLACGALALSPLHIWYSQEARPYALAFLFVAISYLSLVAFQQTGRRLWAVLYGVSVVLCLYTDYSTLYPLLPHALLLLYITRTHGRRSLLVWGAAVVAAVAFLPWLPQMLGTVHDVGMRQASYLSVTPEKVATSFLSIVGVAGQGSYFWGSEPTPWDGWPAGQLLIFVGLLVAGAAGLLALKQRSNVALLTVVGLFGGTIVVGAAISLISPGYAERTIIYALLGWVVLLGAAPFVRVPPVVRATGAASAAFVLILSLVSLVAVYNGDKQHWRELSADSLAAASSGKPLIVYPTVAGVLLDAYHPHAFDGKAIVIPDFNNLPPLARPGEPAPTALWLAYIEVGGIDQLRDQLAARGYERIEHRYYWNPLYLDLYVPPGP